MSDVLDNTGTRDERIIREAKRRFKRVQARETTARTRWQADYRFANGDSDNNYQWPGEVYNSRNGANQPSLTINKTRQHCLQIMNDARQNKAGVSIRPVGNGATYDAAQIFEGVVRHIEYISNAQEAYDTATRFQVMAGLGYWRIVTDYVDDDSFDQEVLIKPLPNPLAVYLDPDIQTVDGSDAKWGFVFSDDPREEVEAEFPQFKGRGSPSNAIDGEDGDWSDWLTTDHIRVAEYYRVTEKTDKLYLLSTGETKRASELPAGLRKLARQDEQTQTREIIERHVEWFKIVGDEIVDERDWPGKFVPIIRVIGEETVIDGELDRKGHTRALKDPQRMYNYNASANVEYGALQSKSPYVAPVAAIEGLETYWETANRVNHAILPYNHVNDQGQEIPKPERQMPPTAAPVFLDGMKASENDMMLVSGQYQAEMGAPSNERTGVAIQERQRQGDNATYHYIDHLASAIRYTGRILIDLIPKVYDTKRVIRILAEDGSEDEVELDPNAKQAHQQVQDRMTGNVRKIFNPGVGRYEVEADVGPAFATKRQEAFNAIVQVLSSAPELHPIIGDLLFKAADFPLADEIAERLQKMVPPQALGGPSPQMEQMQGALQKMQSQLQQALQALAEERLKVKGKDQQKDIDVYEAETHRITALQKMMPMDPEGLRQLVHSLVVESLQNTLGPVVAASAADLGSEGAGATSVAAMRQPNLGQQLATPGGM